MACSRMASSLNVSGFLSGFLASCAFGVLANRIWGFFAGFGALFVFSLRVQVLFEVLLGSEKRLCFHFTGSCQNWFLQPVFVTWLLDTLLNVGSSVSKQQRGRWSLRADAFSRFDETCV